jgi:predicted lipoprotein with Yx(FWY)xxD motif
MRRVATRAALLIALGIAAMVPAGAAAAQTVPGTRPAIEIKTSNLGKVVATPSRLGIYYWDVEKKAGGKIRCTGACAADWPPVFVKGTVPKHAKGVMATFGTIKRAGKRQLTVNGLPAYTYHGDRAGIVLCDNVDGWFAVRPK